MLTRLKQSQEQYGGASKVIDSWLEERQEWLVRYCQLAGLQPFDREKNTLPQANEIREFCQIMVDYLSAGHFEIYDQVVSKCEVHGPKSLAQAQDLYPKINASTDTALNFNDKYAEPMADDIAMDDFDKDLSNLGQEMEERFEFEDELIHILYTKHTESA